MTAEYDIHRKPYKYSTEDWQLLVNILHEYGDKLTTLSRKISIEKKRPSIKSNVSRVRLKIYIALLFSTSFFIVILLTEKSLLIITMALASSPSVSLMLIAALIAANILVVFLLNKNPEKETDIPLNLIEGDAVVMSSRLESAIRLTIAVSDQIEISLAKKLEMDLRIDEAKSALEYYYSVVGSKPIVKAVPAPYIFPDKGDDEIST
jgi:hypothetical protein